MTQKISDKLLRDVLRGDKFDIDLSKTTVYWRLTKTAAEKLYGTAHRL